MLLFTELVRFANLCNRVEIDFNNDFTADFPRFIFDRVQLFMNGLHWDQVVTRQYVIVALGPYLTLVTSASD